MTGYQIVEVALAINSSFINVLCCYPNNGCASAQFFDQKGTSLVKNNDIISGT